MYVCTYSSSLFGSGVTTIFLIFLFEEFEEFDFTGEILWLWEGEEEDDSAFALICDDIGLGGLGGDVPSVIERFIKIYKDVS